MEPTQGDHISHDIPQPHEQSVSETLGKQKAEIEPLQAAANTQVNTAVQAGHAFVGNPVAVAFREFTGDVICGRNFAIII
jgi:hypothetical protein